MKNGVLANSCFQIQNFWMTIQKKEEKGCAHKRVWKKKRAGNVEIKEKKRKMGEFKSYWNSIPTRWSPPRKKLWRLKTFFFLYTHRNDGLSKVKRERNFVFSLDKRMDRTRSLEMGNAVWFHGYMDVTRHLMDSRYGYSSLSKNSSLVSHPNISSTTKKKKTQEF